MTPEEKLQAILRDYNRAENDGANFGEHLTDEDFIRLIENKSPPENDFSEITDDFATSRRHLAGCDLCLAEFKDFYAFFAPARAGETTALKSEIDAAWQKFATPTTDGKKERTNFWQRIFSFTEIPNFSAAFGWGFAALLLVFTSIAVFVAWQAKTENAQLAAQFEREKQSAEERLRTIERNAENSNIAADEKNKLQAEKTELQDKIAQLQSEIERAKQQKPARENSVPAANSPNFPAARPDNSLVAVNTPIYDVFPADAVVRSGANAANKLIVPNGAKSVVLILNAAGRDDFAVSNAVLTNSAGKIIWRGGGLRKDSTGNFALTLARAALKSGGYRLKLSGKNSSGAVAVEYPLTIEIGK